MQGIESLVLQNKLYEPSQSHFPRDQNPQIYS